MKSPLAGNDFHLSNVSWDLSTKLALPGDGISHMTNNGRSGFPYISKQFGICLDDVYPPANQPPRHELVLPKPASVPAAARPLSIWTTRIQRRLNKNL
jgi:hypothetical protein